jgi:NADH-quinone oxidoreductase subunit L
MVSRSHVIFERAPMALMVVATVGTLTALFAATIGVTQTDIKKVLAYSTVSQLGYMFMACGVGAFSAGIFHLMTHAFFKGLLFLAAGSVIHAVSGEQDMRQMGGLRTKIPWTFWTMTAGTFAIAGIPPFAGFFSKDEILWRAYQASWVYWAIGLFTAFLTSFYMFRLWFLTFFGEYRGAAEGSHDLSANDPHHADTLAGAPAPHRQGHGGIHESPMVMVIPLVVLAVLSVVGGWIGSGGRFEEFLRPAFSGNLEGFSPQEVYHGNDRELLLMVISVAVAALGFFLAWVFYYRNPQLPKRVADGLGGFYGAVVHKYYIDELYATLFVKPLIAGSALILWHGIDQDVIDAAVDNSAHGANEVSDAVRHMQSGNVRSYAGWVAAGAALVIAYMVWLGAR